MARFYVYALVDPFNHKPFYIGKGSQLRTLQHFENKQTAMVIVGARTEDIEAEDEAHELSGDVVGPDGMTRKQRRISELKRDGMGHAEIARIVMQDLDEAVAYDVESFLITSCYSTSPHDTDGLLNIQAGHHRDRFRPYGQGQRSNWPLLDKFDLFDATGNRVEDETPTYYVYALVDPKSGAPFYIGKGKAGRMFQHFDDAIKGNPIAAEDPEKLQLLRAALDVTPESKIGRILARGLSEDAAFAIEALLIRFYYGFAMLANQVDGQKGIRVRPKPDGPWKAMIGFDQPHVIDPDSRQDRQWLQDQLIADGIHLPLERVCRHLAPHPFDAVRILDDGGLAKEGDVTSDGQVLTRLKVFVRRKRIQVEARPRNSQQRAWMRIRFQRAGYPQALRRDGVFIPSVWRGARNMTTDVDEAVHRAQVILDILTQPIDAGFRERYGQYLQKAEAQVQVQDTIQESHEGCHDLPASSATTRLKREKQEPVPQTQVQEVVASPIAKGKKIRPLKAAATDCVTRLEEIVSLFEDLEFSGPFPASSGPRIYVKALCTMGDGTIWLLIYCGKQGLQSELRAYSRADERRLTEHLHGLGVQPVRDDFVFKFLECPVTKELGVLFDRICMLLQFATAESQEELIGIPPEYFRFIPT